MRFKTEYNDLKWVSLARDLESSRYGMNNVLVLERHFVATDGRRIHVAEVSKEFCDWIKEHVTGEPGTGDEIDSYFFLGFREKKLKSYYNVFAKKKEAGQAVFRDRPARWPLPALKRIFADKYEESLQMPKVAPKFYYEAFQDYDISVAVNEAKTMVRVGQQNRVAVIAAIVSTDTNGKPKYDPVIEFPTI